MALNRQQKEAVVAEVATVAGSAISAIAADYRGLSVEEMTALRDQARNNNVYLRVVKNTLARLSIKDTDFECMTEGLVGPLVLAFSTEDPGAAARVIKDFAKEHEQLEVKLVSISGKLLDPGQIDALAKLPTYDEAISMLMAVMKAPIEKLTRTINEVPSKLVRTLVAIKDSKESAG